MAEVKPKRIALWTVARSLSTAMVMSFGNYGNVEVFNEMYAGAAGFGPERKDDIPLPFPIEEDLTFDTVKSQLEAEYPTRDLVFLKDHVSAIHGKYDKLPAGFTHTFIIRNPEKTLTSGFRLAKKSGIMDAEQFITVSKMFNNKGFGFGNMVTLADYFDKTLGQRLVILDADDLQQHPEKMLRAFCKAVDLPFRESLLKWDPIIVDIPWHNPKSLINIHKANGAYENALKSTGWITAEPKHADLSETPKVILTAIEEAMPFYQALYSKRLLLDN